MTLSFFANVWEDSDEVVHLHAYMVLIKSRVSCHCRTPPWSKLVCPDSRTPQDRLLSCCLADKKQHYQNCCCTAGDTNKQLLRTALYILWCACVNWLNDCWWHDCATYPDSLSVRYGVIRAPSRSRKPLRLAYDSLRLASRLLSRLAIYSRLAVVSTAAA